MNPDYDKQLEARLTRELKSLGELNAPAGIARRVMRLIQEGQAVPWYRRSWQTWPVSLQVASVLVLFAMFGGICYVGSGMAQSATETVVAQKTSGWFTQLAFLWNLAGVVVQAVVTMVNSLGEGVIIGIALMLALSYAACVGLGSAYVRFALYASRRTNL